MESEPRQADCQFCQQLVKFPPTFDDTLQCSSCGAMYHYEFSGDLAEEIINVEEDAKEWKYAVEWKYVFVGVAVWDEDEEYAFTINYDVKEEDLWPHEDKVYLFFTK